MSVVSSKDGSPKDIFQRVATISLPEPLGVVAVEGVVIMKGGDKWSRLTAQQHFIRI